MFLFFLFQFPFILKFKEIKQIKRRMVKLIFNPKTNGTQKTPSSLISKKIEKNLNPLKDINEFVNDLDLDLGLGLDVGLDQISLKEFNLIPKTIKDIIGLENCAYVLKEWYYKNKKPFLIIGPIGCGKTTLIELFCKEENIQLYTIKSFDKTKKELLKDISLFYEFSFFKKNENKLIFIDEYQNGQSDLLNLIDIATLYEKKYKILIISSDAKGSKLSELKKTSEVYYINEINLNIIKNWVKTFNLNLNENELNLIIQNCKSDKRLLLNNLSFYKNNKTKNTNKNNVITFYKDSDVNLFEILFQNKEFNLNDMYKIYKTDGFMLSNLVQENYLDYNNDIDKIANMAESISYGEILFSDTYESNKTFLPDAHFINSICIPSYYAKSDKSNKNVRSSCINNRYNIYLNNKKIISKINEDILFILFIKKFLNYNLIKTKVLTLSQEGYLKNIKAKLNLEKMELIYKHFSDFNDLPQNKTKNFTLKFKDKINKLN